MIQDNRKIVPLDDEGNEWQLQGAIIQNNIPVLEENYVAKMNANNGFTKNRMFRKIASVPITEWQNAIADGWDLDDPKELYRYLNRDKDYLAVDRINSPRDPHIIIK